MIRPGDEAYRKSAGVTYCSECGTLAEAVDSGMGPQETGVRNELVKLPPEAGEGLLASSMLGMARDLDSGDVSPRDRPNYIKELRISLLTLKDDYPSTEEDDETEVARQKRERRARENGGF